MDVFVIFILKLVSASAFDEYDASNSMEMRKHRPYKGPSKYSNHPISANFYQLASTKPSIQLSINIKRVEENKTHVDGVTKTQDSQPKILVKSPSMGVVINAVQPPKMVTLSQIQVKVLQSGHLDKKEVTKLMDMMRLNESASHPPTKSSQGVSAGVSKSNNQTIQTAGDPNNKNVGTQVVSGNSTTNGSASWNETSAGGSDGSIEVVILQPSLHSTRRPLLKLEPGRRFPSAILSSPNVSMVHTSLVHPPYPLHSYWPIYLTVTMMCLCVLGVCVICCSGESRRRMSGPPQQPDVKDQHDQQLPPYPYSFSYDMRTVDTHPISQVH